MPILSAPVWSPVVVAGSVALVAALPVAGMLVSPESTRPATVQRAAPGRTAITPAAPQPAAPGPAMVRRAASGPAAIQPVAPGPATIRQAAPDAARAGWSWPLHPRPGVIRRFRVGPARWSPGHRGVDLTAVPGQQVLAPATGVVSFAGSVAGRGVLVLSHPGGIRTSYEPVVATPVVGAAVERGQPVARLAVVGSHCAPSPCLHWGARRGEVYLDPLGLLGASPPIVLLPLD